MENYWKDHALESREDLQRLAYGMLNALKPYYSPGKALLHLGETATHHSVRIADMEGFARPLFGLVSLTKGGWDCEELWETCRLGIIHGTDPSHEEYWGDVTGGQLIVERNGLPLAAGFTRSTTVKWAKIIGHFLHSLSTWRCNSWGNPMTGRKWKRRMATSMAAISAMAGIPMGREWLLWITTSHLPCIFTDCFARNFLRPPTKDEAICLRKGHRILPKILSAGFQKEGVQFLLGGA